jgi:hypothetical protein
LAKISLYLLLRPHITVSEAVHFRRPFWHITKREFLDIDSPTGNTPDRKLNGLGQDPGTIRRPVVKKGKLR